MRMKNIGVLRFHMLHSEAPELNRLMFCLARAFAGCTVYFVGFNERYEPQNANWTLQPLQICKHSSYIQCIARVQHSTTEPLRSPMQCFMMVIRRRRFSSCNGVDNPGVDIPVHMLTRMIVIIQSVGLLKLLCERV